MLTIFNTSPEIASAGVDTAVLAMGSLEPKGPHLPVGFDTLLASRFSRDFSAGKAVYLLPVFPYSTAVETRGFPGTASLEQQTLWDVLVDVARVLAKTGFKRMVVLDFSDRNWILKHCVREINLNFGIIQAVWASPKEFAREAAVDLLPDFGAGAVETSLAMALDASLVGDLPEDFLPDAPREYVDYHGLSAVAPQGYWGSPRAASAERGKELYQLMLEKTGEFIDWALGLVEGGAPIGSHEDDGLWWPEGEIPGSLGGLDWHSSLTEISSAAPELVILPTSATEQHSTTQPVCTDYVQALELARRVSTTLDAYLLPALPIVTSWGHIKFPGTVTLSAMTARRVLEDVVGSLSAWGVKKIALLNVHGGNWVIKPTLVEINRKFPDVTLVATGDILSYRGQAPVEDIHAGSGEGSFIKAFYPDCFKEADLVDFSPKCPASAFDFGGIGCATPKGVWGYPSGANAEDGRKYIETESAQIADYIAKALSDAPNFGK